MECKFIKHGIALSYDHVLKPCCLWQMSPEWKQIHHIKKSDISTWHQHADIIQTKNTLNQDQWPDQCGHCKVYEEQGRQDSMRGNANQAYQHYTDDDITLEIRPGNTCNFACATCWPEASSRVIQFYHRAGLADMDSIDSSRIDDFNFLLPISKRIKDVVLLGGEPFYDKSCQKFLSWAEENLTATIMIFTNGSVVDFDFLKNYQGKLVLIFSLDAVGKPAEFIRYGTEWEQVEKNYQLVRNCSNVETRVNIVFSAYNLFYIRDLIDFLCADWPNVVSFGTAYQSYFQESVIPKQFRNNIIKDLNYSIDKINTTDIESGQKSNAINALTSVINNLQLEWNQEEFQKFKNITTRLNQAKNIILDDYCPEIVELLR